MQIPQSSGPSSFLLLGQSPQGRPLPAGELPGPAMRIGRPNHQVAQQDGLYTDSQSKRASFRSATQMADICWCGRSLGIQGFHQGLGHHAQPGASTWSTQSQAIEGWGEDRALRLGRGAPARGSTRSPRGPPFANTVANSLRPLVRVSPCAQRHNTDIRLPRLGRLGTGKARSSETTAACPEFRTSSKQRTADNLRCRSTDHARC